MKAELEIVKINMSGIMTASGDCNPISDCEDEF